MAKLPKDEKPKKATRLTKESFFTRDKANAGIKLPLFTPDGEASEEWIQVRGVDSDAYRAAETEGFRRLRDAASAVLEAKTEDERKTIAQKAEVETLRARAASLVCGWSFDEPCTTEAVEEVLRQAPQIQDQIMEVARNRNAFFSSTASDSMPTSDTSSG